MKQYAITEQSHARRKSGMILSAEKIMLLGVTAAIALGVVGGIFYTSIAGVTDVADITISKFTVQKTGTGDNHRVIATASLKNVGTVPITSVALGEFTAGKIVVSGDPTVTHQGITIQGTGCDLELTGIPNSATPPVTEPDGTLQDIDSTTDCPPASGTSDPGAKVQLTGMADFDGDSPLPAKGSAIFKLVIQEAGAGGINIGSDIAEGNEATLVIAFSTGEEADKTNDQTVVVDTRVK